jgi:hypothetical protein
MRLGAALVWLGLALACVSALGFAFASTIASDDAESTWSNPSVELWVGIAVALAVAGVACFVAGLVIRVRRR